MSRSNSMQIFSAFTLKVLACVFMFFDHLGVVFFPECALLRIVGRLAFPIFAYFIAEGCRYTKNKLRRFLNIFVLGIVCEVFYILFVGKYYGNILLEFSASVLLIYTLQKAKLEYQHSKEKCVIYSVLFVLMLIGGYIYCEKVGFDYRFYGLIAPVCVVLFDKVKTDDNKNVSWENNRSLSLFAFSVALLLLTFFGGISDYQWCCLFALPLLLLYNGKLGNYKFKYGFYLFYPLHILLLNVLDMIIEKVNIN